MKLNHNGRTLIKNGKDFFYLADTCWSAFTNIEDSEWDFYLSKRKEQNFNVLQINILPQWDASEPLINRSPFIYRDDGTIDFTKLDDSYFARARKMCLKAKDKGFELALVALWCNYVPGTWANSMSRNKVTFPFTFIELLSQYIIKYFGDISSLWLVSGDTDFNDESTPYYKRMSELLREKTPNVLQTMHIKGRYDYLPKELESIVDIYFYQSGHNSSDRAIPYSLATSFYQRELVKPVINSEPCYEQMGYSRMQYGRWSQAEVRKAAWESVLSGACAGVTYGAAGIYSWHRINKGFIEDVGEGFDTPQAWENALIFPGAYDYSRIKELFSIYKVTDLIPSQDLLVVDKPGIRLSRNEKHLIIYVPYNTRVELTNDIDLDLDNSTVYDLSSSKTQKGIIIKNDEKFCIEQHTYLEDVLITIKIKEKNNA